MNVSKLVLLLTVSAVSPMLNFSAFATDINADHLTVEVQTWSKGPVYIGPDGDDLIYPINYGLHLQTYRSSSLVPGAKKFTFALGSGGNDYNPTMEFVSSELDNSNYYRYLAMNRANGGEYAGYNLALDPEGTSGVYVGNNLKVKGDIIFTKRQGDILMGQFGQNGD